jgi:hypothetical protein
MQNSLAPGFAVINYGGVAGRTHRMTIPLRPTGSLVPGVEPDVLLRDDSVVSFSEATDVLIAAFVSAYHTSTAFGNVAFWSKPTADSDPVWIYQYNSGDMGESSTANTALLQSVYTFRTTNGGIYKLYLMEGVGVANTVDIPPLASYRLTVGNAIVAWNGCVIGRDGGFPAVPIACTMKTNDALRKKALLDA